ARLAQHGLSVEPRLGDRPAARAAMWQRAGERGADGVRALGEKTELRSRDRRKRRSKRANVGIPRMPLRDLTEQHERALLADQHFRGGSVRVARLESVHG